MLRILIAEDEIFVRKSLKNAIEAANKNFAVVAEASNGKQALELFEANEIDLILTDICMPVMDGMEFIMKVREKDDSVRIIILSCLDEFEYARKALKYRVSDYFLKAETDPAELVSILEKAESAIQADKSSITEKSGTKKLLEQSIYEIQKEFFRMLLWGPKMSAEVIEKKIKGLNLSLCPQNLFVAYMELDNLNSIKENSSVQELELIDFSVLNIFREISEQDGTGYIFTRSNGNYIIIISLKGIPSIAKVREKLSRLFSMFMEQFKKIFPLSLTAGLSASHNSFRELPDAYNQSVLAFKRRFFAGKGCLLFYENFTNTRHHASDINNTDKEFIISSVQSGDVVRIQKECESLLNSMNSQGCTEKQLRRAAMDIFISIERKASEPGNAGNSAPLSGFDISSSINEIDTFKELKDWLFLNIEAVSNYYIVEKNNAGSVNLVDRIKAYMENNYSKNINLNVVANHFDMNPCYISLIFKEKTGKNFVDFLSEIRLEKAKSLLKSGSLSIQGIGEMVGYPNPQYFSKVFKKATGISPNEFRTCC